MRPRKSPTVLNEPKLKTQTTIKRAIIWGFVGLLATAFDGQKPEVRENASARRLVDDTGYLGTVLIYDLSKQSFTSGHSELVDRRFIPASTFKIFSSLVALETRAIDDNHSTIAWDGIERDRSEINRDLDMQTAFRLSAVPHFQHLVREIGTEKMQHYIDLVQYGNQNISGGLDTFWLTGDLRISPREQVNLLVRLYKNDLPFRPEVMEIVKEMMLTEETEGVAIRAKTGWAIVNEGENVGWWIGWQESGDDVDFFATAITSRNPGKLFGRTRLSLTRDVLTLLGN